MVYHVCYCMSQKFVLYLWLDTLQVHHLFIVLSHLWILSSDVHGDMHLAPLDT